MITSPLAKRPIEDKLSEESIDNEELRPVGCKKAKQRVVDDKRDDEIRKELLKAKQDIAATQIRRNELMEEQNVLALFSIVPSAGDDIAAQYLKLKKQIALQKLQASLSVEQ